MDTEEFPGVVYSATVEVFKKEQGSNVDSLGYPEVPDDYLWRPRFYQKLVIPLVRHQLV